MAIQLIGAGLGRTGTHALKLALEELLGGTCHHMMEVFGRPEEIPVWAAAMEGDEPDWSEFLADYSAIVDFPGGALWRELADAFPDAPVLLSTRASGAEWWASADATIFDAIRRGGLDEVSQAQHEMVRTMLAERFTTGWDDEATAIAAYDAHNRAVREAIPAGRLFEYRPGDGWAPLCAALGVAEPDTPFPHTNTRAEFRAAIGLDQA
jgi:Sulfotransferase domain